MQVTAGHVLTGSGRIWWGRLQWRGSWWLLDCWGGKVSRLKVRLLLTVQSPTFSTRIPLAALDQGLLIPPQRAHGDTQLKATGSSIHCTEAARLLVRRAAKPINSGHRVPPPLSDRDSSSAVDLVYVSTQIIKRRSSASGTRPEALLCDTPTPQTFLPRTSLRGYICCARTWPEQPHAAQFRKRLALVAQVTSA